MYAPISDLGVCTFAACMIGEMLQNGQVFFGETSISSNQLSVGVDGPCRELGLIVRTYG